MRAITYTHTGGPEVLELVDKPVTDPGDGEVRVRVIVSGVNPTDWKSRAGSGAGKELPTPQVPNQDGAGIVDAVGPGVAHVAVGDRVWIWDAAFQRTEGTAQELAIVPAERVVPLPDDASFDLGASVGIPALTAHRTLTVREDGPAELTPGALDGTTVLVTGGAGAVSHAAIQLAVWAGATVLTTVSGDEKGELARRAGAHHVINYKAEDVASRIHELAPNGVDTIVEVNAIANFATDLEVAAPGAVIALYAGGGGTLSFPERGIMGNNVRLQGILTYTTTAEQKAAAVRSVSAAIAAGVLGIGDETGLPITRFPLEQTAEAHKAVEDGAVGKVLIDVAAS